MPPATRSPRPATPNDPSLHDSSAHESAGREPSLSESSLHGTSLHESSLHGSSLHGSTLNGTIFDLAGVDPDALDVAPHAPSGATKPAAGQKVCVQCGKDVAHEKRMKDASGAYWCIDCGQKDSARKHGRAVQCPDCHEKFPRDNMQAFDGTPLCEKCHAIRTANRQRIEKVLAKTHNDEAAAQAKRTQIIVIVGVIAILCVVVLTMMW